MNRATFYNAIRPLFGGSLTGEQVKGMDGILDAFQSYGDGDQGTLAYALATAFHETGRRMVPVREGFAKSDAGARQAVNRLAAKRGPKSAVAKYAKPDPVTGHVYYGRGHVQLTLTDNYARDSNDAGHNLVSNPDMMLDPVISARVLIKGLLDGRWNGQGKGLRFYLDKGDLIGARRTVNVLDKAELIAEYHRKFLAAINAAGFGKTAPIQPQKPVGAVPSKPAPLPPSPQQTIPAPAKPASSGFFNALIEAILKLFGRKPK